MCEKINIGDGVAFVCGHKNHECNEDARVYGTSDGERHFFNSDKDAEEWYENNYQRTTMGSVACSICGSAMIDGAYKMDL